MTVVKKTRLITVLFFRFVPQVAQLDQELVRVTALQVVFDLLQTFGLEAFKVNASVPELDSNDASTSSSEKDTSEKEEDEEEENGEEGDDNEKRSDGDDAEENQAPDTDTAASVLTILTGILESEVLFAKFNQGPKEVGGGGGGGGGGALRTPKF